MKKDSYPRFLRSEEYQRLLNASSQITSKKKQALLLYITLDTKVAGVARVLDQYCICALKWRKGYWVLARGSLHTRDVSWLCRYAFCLVGKWCSESISPAEVGGCPRGNPLVLYSNQVVPPTPREPPCFVFEVGGSPYLEGNPRCFCRWDVFAIKTMCVTRVLGSSGTLWRQQGLVFLHLQV